PDWSQKLAPAFTCIERPVKELGRTAVRLITQRRGGERAGERPAKPEQILLDSRIVAHDSVRELP
ncbi:MAG: substrate-binding domain-containing protein, partial [Clostridiales bacterium]|nr:substrate-binding domain-containing protein [Clostridiales bacterium]